MTYHLKNWEYFIEMSWFIPGQVADILSDSLGRTVSNVAFTRIVNMAKNTRTRDGVETIMLLTLADYIESIDSIFDKFLENIDKQMQGLKDTWAENHKVI